MSKKKSKIKARRRAKKLQDQAWEAEAAENTDLAVKAIDRALGECQDNPEIWNDSGLILHRAGQYEEAEKAFRNAILIAPDYAEAYANLASLVSQLGRTIQAERLQRKSVEIAPHDRAMRERLNVYQALLPEVLPPEPSPPTEASESSENAALGLDRYDWETLEQDLTTTGCAFLHQLLTPEECAELIDLYALDEPFEKTVQLNAEAGTSGAYRFFRRPLPSLVRRLRVAVYARLAPIADRWNEFPGRDQRWPAHHREFLAQCAEAGQNRTTPILFRYLAPAVNALHQDVWGKVYFPLQLAVTLSPRGGEKGFSGGAFVLADSTTGRKAHRLEVPTSLGDAVIFCTRERLVKVADRYAFQSVRHGMAPLVAGERYVLGVPFHNYKG